MYPARYYASLEDKNVCCELCPHNCRISDGKYGICNVRKNVQGKLYSELYQRISACAADPVEKKPLYHYYPGRKVLSIGSLGCNMHCKFCQNQQISQNKKEAMQHIQVIGSADLLGICQKQGLNMIAYTYNEPTVSIEFVMETAALFHKNGLKNIMVSNGYINKKPLQDLLQYIDAFNIDLKSFSQDFYTKITGGELAPVLNSIDLIRKYGKHVELTYLLIPGLNDDLDEFSAMLNDISENWGREQILHISRYYPAFELNTPATSTELMHEFLACAKDKLSYVYAGNANEFNTDTFCPNCYASLIQRRAYNSNIVGMKNNRCIKCNTKIVGNF